MQAGPRPLEPGKLLLSEKGEWGLLVARVEPGRFREESCLLLQPRGPGGLYRPLLRATWFGGRPGQGLRAWVELWYPPRLVGEGGEEVQVEGENPEVELVGAVAARLPQDGSLMLLYPGLPTTSSLLQKGALPAATPAGRAMVLAGFLLFKDWYFAEGWREGEPKLQGWRPGRGQGDARRRLAAELQAFLESPGGLPTRWAWEALQYIGG